MHGRAGERVKRRWANGRAGGRAKLNGRSNEGLFESGRQIQVRFERLCCADVGLGFTVFGFRGRRVAVASEGGRCFHGR